ncbi:response regulator transcription factor [Pseudonocardia sp.]|uniref:response regulator transcription factor n=1 Tax=Pseudonocardia sp. TaxID=60912 RepID=UPI003D1288CA
MVPEGAAVPVAVLGPPSLLLTSLVAALRCHGHPAELLASGSAFGDARPGVLIVDLGPPRAVETIPRAVAAGWTVIAVGAWACVDRAAAAVVAGAQAWASTDTPFADLAQLVVAGPGLRMGEAERSRWHEVHAGAEAERAGRVERLRRLSRREREVLRLLAEGRRAADIADDLFVALATVRTHIRSILVKLEVNAQDQAITVYRDAGGH